MRNVVFAGIRTGLRHRSDPLSESIWRRCPRSSGRDGAGNIVERIGQREAVDVAGQRRIDEEAHRHPRAARRARRTAARSRSIRSCGTRMRPSRARCRVRPARSWRARQVVREERRLRQLAGMHLDRLEHRMELPVANRRQVGHEIDGDQAPRIRRASRARGYGAAQALLVPETRDRAQHVVERHQREAEREAAGDERQQSAAPAAGACAVQACRPCSTAYAMKPA